jgi:hypothetical protein
MFGYFAETFLMTASELERKKKHLLAFAASQGSEMQAIFTEHLDTRPAAIESLIQKARREKVTTVAVRRPLTSEPGTAANSRRPASGS